jgi:mono/diheme cytochrome c family protein
MKTVRSAGAQWIAVLVGAASVLSALGSGFAHRNSAEAPPPAIDHPPPGDAGHGRKLFGQSCAHCHGDDARGNGEDGDGPDLSSLAIGNARIAAVIRHGIPEEMPSFAKKHGLPDIADLTAYLRTLR